MGSICAYSGYAFVSEMSQKNTDFIFPRCALVMVGGKR